MNSVQSQASQPMPFHAAADPRHTTLFALLDESLDHPPEYGGGLSSHLPMALAALHALGASSAQMHRFAGSYLRRSGLAQRRVERRPATALADREALQGRIDAFPALQAHFGAALQARGADAVLRETVPSLLCGMAGAAFHGLIRTAHAAETGHMGELAAALAYGAARWTPLPPASEPAAPVDDVPAWMVAVEASLRQHDAGWHSAAAMITGRMADATQTTTYRALAGGPRAVAALGDSLLLLACAAAALYQQTGNFTVLHMATAMRAALVLAPWCPPASHPAVLASVWRATLAARIASAAQPTSAPEPELLPGPGAATVSRWDPIRAAACESDDDHVIKLVHAMAWLSRHAAGAAEHDATPVWLAAARRAVQAGRS